MTHHRSQAEIFDESAGLRRNTVNGCFPNAPSGTPTTSGNPVNQAPAQFDHWRIRKALALSYAQLSTLRKPCR
jgi:hypothetical protein